MELAALATGRGPRARVLRPLDGRTTERIDDIPVPQASVSQVICSLPRLDESDAPVYHQVRQEQIAAGETTQNRVEMPTEQEQVIVQKIPEVQVVERIQEQGDSTGACATAHRRTNCARQSLRYRCRKGKVSK